MRDADADLEFIVPKKEAGDIIYNESLEREVSLEISLSLSLSRSLSSLSREVGDMMSIKL